VEFRSTALRQIAVCLVMLVLTGCAIPRSGPAESTITEKSADLAGFTMVNVSAASVANYRVREIREAAGTGGVPVLPPTALMPGDTLSVRISESKPDGLFQPLATGGTSFGALRVDSNGMISLPYAGRIKVAGLDPRRVEDRISARLAGVAYEPQVQVELISDRGSSILISGEVKAAGRFSLLDSPLTLIDLIAKAGGPLKPAHQLDVVIRRGKAIQRIPLEEVMRGANRQLRGGDEVIIEPDAKYFNAVGAVVKPGQMEFLVPNPNLLDALSQTGGLNSMYSSSSGVFVFRLREEKAWLDADNRWQEGPVVFKFDMSKPETMFIAQAFGVKSGDTIYVTNAPAIEWYRQIQPIAQTLSTLRGGVSVVDGVDLLLNPPANRR
jgi:polysaccharide biosynthesis/export protein